MMPPIDFNRLRAFEAAARHESFTRAAAELNVSQPAVSQQVRALEEQLKTTLFVRGAKSLRLTDQGARLALVVTDAMARLTDGLARAVTRDPEGAFRISCLPAFATFWLAPRLHRFAAAYPKLEVALLSQGQVTDFRSSEADVGIRWGRGPWPHTAATLLFREADVPVCAPHLADRVRLLQGDVAVLHDLSRTERLWPDWLKMSGLDWPAPSASLRFETTADLISAAQAGAGVALVREGLVKEALDAGRLVRPWPDRLPSAEGYHLVHAPARARDPKVAAFAAWLRREVAAEDGSAPLP